MKFSRAFLVLSLTFACTGCTTFDKALHELQPHRLWRVNRGPAPGREDSAFFSVSDNLAVEAPVPGVPEADQK